MKSLSILLVLILPSCALPLSTAAPHRVEALGTGEGAIRVQVEKTLAEVPGISTSDSLAFRAQGAIGLSPKLDLEFGLDGAVHYVPIPLGGSAGLRYQLVAKSELDVGIHARVGGIASPLDSPVNEEGEKEPTGFALFSSVGGSAQWKPTKWFQPLISIGATPASIRYREVEGRVRNESAFIGTVTLGANFTHNKLDLIPFLQTSLARSTHLGRSPAIAGGLAFAIRGL